MIVILRHGEVEEGNGYAQGPQTNSEPCFNDQTREYLDEDWLVAEWGPERARIWIPAFLWLIYQGGSSSSMKYTESSCGESEREKEKEQKTIWLIMYG